MPRSAVCLVGELVGALGLPADASAGPAGAWRFRVVSMISPRGWVLSVLTPEASRRAASGTPDRRHDLAMTDVIPREGRAGSPLDLTSSGNEVRFLS
jgi:hypothetical protein